MTYKTHQLKITVESPEDVKAAHPLSPEEWAKKTASGEFFDSLGRDFKVIDEEKEGGTVAESPCRLTQLQWNEEHTKKWFVHLIQTCEPLPYLAIQDTDNTEAKQKAKKELDDAANDIWLEMDIAKKKDEKLLEQEKTDSKKDPLVIRIYKKHERELRESTQCYDVIARNAKAKNETKRRHLITVLVLPVLFVLPCLALLFYFYSGTGDWLGALHTVFSPYTAFSSSPLTFGIVITLTCFYLAYLVSSIYSYVTTHLSPEELKDAAKIEGKTLTTENRSDPHAVIVRYLKLARQRGEDRIKQYESTLKRISDEYDTIPENDSPNRKIYKDKIDETKNIIKSLKQQQHKLYLDYIITREQVFLTNRRKIQEIGVNALEQGKPTKGLSLNEVITEGAKVIATAPAFIPLSNEEDEAIFFRTPNKLMQQLTETESALVALREKEETGSEEKTKIQQQIVNLKAKESEYRLQLLDYGILRGEEKGFVEFCRPPGLTEEQYRQYLVQLSIEEGRLRMTNAMRHPWSSTVWELGAFKWENIGKTLTRKEAAKVAISRDNTNPIKTDQDKFKAHYSWWQKFKQNWWGNFLILCKILSGAALCFALCMSTHWFPMEVAIGLAVCNAIAATISRSVALHKDAGSIPEEARTLSDTAGKKKGGAHWVKEGIVGIIILLASIAAGATAWYGLTNERGLPSIVGSGFAASPLFLALCGIISFACIVSFLSFQAKGAGPNINKFFNIFTEQFDAAYKNAVDNNLRWPKARGITRAFFVGLLTIFIAGTAGLLAWVIVTGGMSGFFGSIGLGDASIALYLGAAAAVTTIFVNTFSQVHKVVDLIAKKGKPLSKAWEKLKEKGWLIAVALIIAMIGDIIAYSIAGGYMSGMKIFAGLPSIATWFLTLASMFVLAAISLAFTWSDSLENDNVTKVGKALGITPKYNESQMKAREEVALKDIIAERAAKEEKPKQGEKDQTPSLSPPAPTRDSMSSSTPSPTAAASSTFDRQI